MQEVLIRPTQYNSSACKIPDKGHEDCGFLSNTRNGSGNLQNESASFTSCTLIYNVFLTCITFTLAQTEATDRRVNSDYFSKY